MKKLISLVLALALACSLALPAAAAEQTDERLSAVTLKIKAALDLDTDDYTDFYGDLDDNPLSPVWYLEWSGEDEWLSISATEDGKILSFSTSGYSTLPSNGQFAPAFPAGDQDSAKAAAQAFLDKVLGDGESAVFNESSAASLNATRYRFSGEVLLNGLSAGLSFSIAVNCEDNRIVSFYRDDLTGTLMGGIPAPDASITQAQAAQALREALALRLEYVLPEDGGTAILRYLPERGGEYGDEYYVDAVTGELVNLSQLYRDASKGEFSADLGNGSFNLATSAEAADTAGAMEAPAAEPTLSAAELEGVDKLEGVLDRDALDSKARAVDGLGLDSYTLSTASYSVDREEPEDGEPVSVTAVLRYGKQVGDTTWRRTISLDARTGELLTVSTSGRLPDGAERKVDFQAAQAAAEDFLTQMVPDQFDKTELYNSSEASDGSWSASHSFTYAQKENGYFYTNNAFYVSVDVTDGSISSYWKYFDDAVTFESPDGIVTMDQALDAWLDTYETTLQYVLVPAAIDFSQPEYAPLEGYGLSYLYRLAVGYQLERFEYVYGIDAKTGEAAYHNYRVTDTGLTYDDITGHWAQVQVETLAQYNVGYAGGSFLPEKELTQIDLIALLVSTRGYSYQLDDDDAADGLYSRAYSMGLLTREERDDSALLTRAEAVKFILDAAGYSHVAQLEGIFRTGFADDSEIPSQYYGYAALAQGLGIISGAPGGFFLPNDGATRAEAAVMLYNLMNR